MTDPLDRWALLAQVASTLFMAGLIWFVQVVHYPLFDGVGAGGFARYAARHQALTTWVVGPPMLVEAATAALLLARRPGGMPAPLLWAGAGLLAAVWLSTVLLQVPRHTALALGFDADAHRLLVTSNWVRTACWSARGALVLALTAGQMK